MMSSRFLGWQTTVSCLGMLVACTGPAGISNLSGEAAPAEVSGSGAATGGASDTDSSAQGLSPADDNSSSDSGTPITEPGDSNQVENGNAKSPTTAPVAPTKSGDRTVRLFSVATNQELDANLWTPSLPRYAFWDDDHSDTTLLPPSGANALFLLTNDANRCLGSTVQAANRQSADWLVSAKMAAAGQASGVLYALHYGVADANRLCTLNNDSTAAMTASATSKTSAKHALCFVVDPSLFGGPIVVGQQVCVDVSGASHGALAAYLLQRNPPKLPCTP